MKLNLMKSKTFTKLLILAHKMIVRLVPLGIPWCSDSLVDPEDRRLKPDREMVE